MDNDSHQVYKYQFSIVPADTNPVREISLSLLVNRLLDVATRHADKLGIGYEQITTQNRAWVFARLAIDMLSYPKPYSTMEIVTWVEDTNRHFSTRCFKIQSPDETITYGYARSIWSMIDLTERTSQDLSQYPILFERNAKIDCPIASNSKIRDCEDGEKYPYQVMYGDLDFNQHLNSGKQIEHLLNVFTKEHFTKYRISRFEINYVNEAQYNNKLEIIKNQIEPNRYTLIMKHSDDTKKVICRAKTEFTER